MKYKKGFYIYIALTVVNIAVFAGYYLTSSVKSTQEQKQMQDFLR